MHGSMRVSRYLCGETSYKPTSGPRRLQYVPGHDFRIARHSLPIGGERQWGDFNLLIVV